MPATADLYAVLGAAPDATGKAISRAYRTLARRRHPDLHPGETAAEQRFEDISATDQMLRDPARRAAYDQDRSGLAGHPGWFPAGGNGRSRRERCARPSGRQQTMPWSSRGLLHPQDHGSLQDIALHSQLGDLPLELAQPDPFLTGDTRQELVRASECLGDRPGGAAASIIS